MNSNQKFSLNDGVVDPILEDEIDLKKLFDSLYRNKRLIAIFSLFGVLLSGLIAFRTKKVWQGEFQIVLESGKGKAALSINPKIANWAGLSPNNDALETEVGILKSPSVLMNIFQFVKAQKSLKNEPIEELRFREWENKNLDIQLEQGTSILNLAYRDTDKDLVLPVLNRISTTYQDYSGRKRMRSIELGEEYFKEQIAIFKSRSIESAKVAQQFAIDQDLTVLQGEAEIDKEISNFINIEGIRVKAANQIRFIDQQLEQIQDLKGPSDQIMYAASTIPAITELSDRLKAIDSRLAKLRVIYKEKDTSIQNLLKERIFLIDLLKRQVKGFLLAKKADAQARLKAAERPEGVLIKYRQLISVEAKDKSTLNTLENQYRALLLEKARSEDPWELITKPTLLPNPVAPSNKRILAFGFLGGIFAGSGVALINDRRKDIIYSMTQMESLVRWPLLSVLPVGKKQFWVESLELVVASCPFSNAEGSIALISVGEIADSVLTQLDESLRQSSLVRQYKITKDLREATKCSNLVVVTALGITRNQELIETRKKLLLQKTPVLGLLVLSDIILNT
ncbi:GumC family protein [Prochlorococcus sp. MIT 1307]|uniref:GumC family protein n=1 Tax=Prochlorococcus sp. MIT 1307 TaxID=3096219 RepID=UPI002A75FCED|nr:Wzz/FepE/Etk N-terminal domain-containing protein [Prochlorococcus sp. MIT 1307]